MRFPLIILFSFLVSKLIAQPTFYERTYGLGRGVFIDKALNGNYIIGANTGAPPNYQAYWFLIRTNGDTLKSFNYSNSGLNCIRQTPESGFIIVGDSGDNVLRKANLIRLDSSGSLTWNKSYPTSEWGTYGASVIQYGNQYFAGIVDDGDTWDNYFYIYHCDSLGETIDSTVVNNSTYFRQNAHGMQLTLDSAIIVVSTDAFSQAMHLSKLSSFNTTLWSQVYYDPSNTFGFNSSSIIQTIDTGFIIVGYKDSLMGGSAPIYGYLLKTNSTGDTSWSKSFYFPGFHIRFVDVVQDSVGSFYVTGELRNRMNSNDYITILMKTDSTGDSLWTKYFSGYGVSSPNSMILDNQGLPISVGFTEDTISQQYYIHLISSDSTGNIYTGVVKNISSNLISVYPNPFQDIILIQNLESVNGEYQIQLMDLQGRIVFEDNNHIGQSIDLHFLSPSIYFLQVNDGKNSFRTMVLKQGDRK